MKCIGVQELLPQTSNTSSTFSVDFITPQGAAGAEVYLITSDRQSSASVTLALSRIRPDGTAAAITSAAIISNTTTRVAIIPELTSVSNVMASAPGTGTWRMTVTFSAGTYDLRAYAAFYN